MVNGLWLMDLVAQRIANSLEGIFIVIRGQVLVILCH